MLENQAAAAFHVDRVVAVREDIPHDHNGGFRLAHVCGNGIRIAFVGRIRILRAVLEDIACDVGVAVQIDVFVAGRAVKRDGKLIDHNLENVFSKLDESRNHILSAGGLLPDWAAESTAAA